MSKEKKTDQQPEENLEEQQLESQDGEGTAEDIDQQEPEAPPEEPKQQIKELKPAARARINECYTHASRMASLSSYDFDYANSLLTECVSKDPMNVDYIDAFLENLKKKYKNNKKGSRKTSSSKGPMKKAHQKEDWLETLRLGVDALGVNPWDYSTIKPVAEACEQLGCVELELRLLKFAKAAKPKDAEVNRHCARTLGRLKQFDQAIACWHVVEEAKKNDPEPGQMISALSVAKARQQAGLSDDADETTNISLARTSTGGSAETKTKKKDENRRIIPLTKRQVLERAIAEDPSDIENYAKMSDMLIKEARFADAGRVLDRGAECADKTDFQDKETIEDARMRLAKAQWKTTEQEAKMKNSDKLKEIAQQRREQSFALELEIFERRYKNHPDDKKVQYEYGLRLKLNGQYAQAAKQFQQARTWPRRKILATYELGQCMRLLKQYAQALKCYEATIIIAEDDPPTYRDCLYWSGVIFMAMKQYDNAEKRLAALVERKPDYKDARARLDKVRSMRHNS